MRYIPSIMGIKCTRPIKHTGKVKKLQKVAANPASTEQEYNPARKEAEGALKNAEQAREKAADTYRNRVSSQTW